MAKRDEDRRGRRGFFWRRRMHRQSLRARKAAFNETNPPTPPAAPTLTSIGPQTVDEDDTLIIPLEATDTDGDNIEFIVTIDGEDVSNIPGATLDQGSQPGNTRTGSLTLVVPTGVVDNGIRAYLDVTAEAGPYSVGTPYSITAIVRDAAGTQLTDFEGDVTFEAFDVAGTFNQSTDTLVSGVAQVTFTPFEDGDVIITGDISTAQPGQTTFTVAPVASTLTLDPLVGKTVAEGSSDSIAVSATDSGSNPIEITGEVQLPDDGGTIPLPDFMVLTQNAQVGTTRTASLALDPQLADEGIYVVRFTATTSGDVISDTVVVEITANQAPVLAPIGAITALQGQEIVVPVSASDSDSGDTLTLSLINSPPEWVSLTDNGNGTGNLTINAPPNVTLGDYLLTVQVQDDGFGALTDSETLTITVSRDDVFIGADQGGGLYQVVIYTHHYSELIPDDSGQIGDWELYVDPTSPTGYNMTAAPGANSRTAAEAGTASRMVFPVVLPPGTYECYALHKAPNGSSDSFQLQLGDSDIIRRSLAEDGSWLWMATITFTTTIDGLQEVVVYREESDLPLAALVIQESSLGAISSLPAESPRTPPGNTRPVIATVANQTVDIDDSVNIEGSATDSEGDDLTFTFEVDGGAAPSFMTFVDNADGTYSLDIEPLSGDSGTYNCVVTCTDDGDPVQADTETFTVTVAAAPVSAVQIHHALDGERADGYNGWSNPAGQIFDQGDGRDQPDWQIRAAWTNTTNNTFVPERSTEQVPAGSTRSIKFFNGKEPTNGKGRAMVVWGGPTNADKYVTIGEDLWISYLIYDNNSNAALQSQLGSGGGYWMHYQIHNNSTEQSGYGSTKNPSFAVQRTYHQDYDTYRVAIRSNAPGGQRPDDYYNIPFYQGQWQRFVWHIRQWNETSGTPDAVCECWTAAGTDPLQKVLDLGPLDMPNQRFGYRYAGNQAERQNLFAGIYSNSGQTSSPLFMYMDRLVLTKDDPNSNQNTMDPLNIPVPIPVPS